MKIGELQERNVTGRKILFGTISTLAFTIPIELQETPKTDNPNCPSFVIFGKSNSGSRIQIGAAWIKILKSGPNSGAEFLTITIDDPNLPRALNVAAFKNPETGNWDITFRRRQEKVT